MNREHVQQLLAGLAAYPGIRGCALADAGSGMVWFHAGELQDMESTAEAAIELWRVQLRHPARFAGFGAPQSAAFSFSSAVVSLFPCTGSGLVLVCIAAKGAVDWAGWGERVQELKTHLA